MDNFWIILFLVVLTYSSKAQDDENKIKDVENKNLQIRHACWDSRGPPVLSAQCPRDTAIHVIRAGLKMANHIGRYDKCMYNEDDCGCLYGEAGCNMSDPRKACMGTPACRLDVTVQYIRTDKCSGFTNYMFIEFECVPLGKISIESICSNTEADAEFGYIKGPGALSVDGRTQCDCTLTTSPYSEMSVTLLDYHSDTYTCSQEKLVVQYGRNAQQFCSDRYEGGQKISAGVNKVALTFTTEGRKDAGGFWLKYQAEPLAAIKVQCAYSVEPRTTKKKILRKTSKPVPRNPTTIPFIEPNEPNEVVDLEPETTRVYDNEIHVTTEEPKKLNDVSTKSTPWWWRFSLKNHNDDKDGLTTTFPPWFKEVEATEFPAWIKKTVTPSENVRKQKEKIIKRIRLTENRQDQEQKLLESGKIMQSENKIIKRPDTKDRVHGDDIFSDQQSEIQISRHLRLPQQNHPSKYHAARKPGKFTRKPKFSKTFIRRSNFTLPRKRPRFRTNARKAKSPNNVHEMVYTLEPTSYPDYDTTTVVQEHEKTSNEGSKVTVIEIDAGIPKTERKTIHSKVQKLSPNVKTRLNQQRAFLNRVRKQKNQWRKLRSQSVNSLKPSKADRKRVTNREDPSYIIGQDHQANNLLSPEYYGDDFPNGRHNYDVLKNNDNENQVELKENSNTDEYDIFKEEVRPPRPRPRLKRPRQNIHKRRQKGDLRDNPQKEYNTIDDYPDEFVHTVTPHSFEDTDLLPNSRVTQIADIFRPNTIHTSNLINMFESKKTQFTLLEPTPPSWSFRNTKGPLSKSRFIHSLHEYESPSLGQNNFELNPSLSVPSSIPAALSTTISKTAAKDVNKSAKNKTHGSESLASRSRGTGELAKLPGLPYSSENSIREGESITVTIIAASVIGSILLIVIIGIVVRFVINRADPNHSIRQHHKKECIVRRNQRERGKSYA